MYLLVGTFLRMQRIGASPEHLCGVLGIQRPVLGAPMANISGGVLAAAVSNAGDLGFVGGGYGDPEWIEREISLVDHSLFGIGLITWNMAKGALAAVLSHLPAAVWLSFGDPQPHIGAIQAAGVVAVCQVGTVAEAIVAANAYADVIVVQESEAGGHGRLDEKLSELLPAISMAIPETPLLPPEELTTVTTSPLSRRSERPVLHFAQLSTQHMRLST